MMSLQLIIGCVIKVPYGLLNRFVLFLFKRFDSNQGKEKNGGTIWYNISTPIKSIKYKQGQLSMF